MITITYLLLVAWIITFIILCFTKSCLVALVSGFLLHTFIGLGHNYLHYGTEQPLRYLFDLTLFRHRNWFVSHVISHHSYPNTSIDFELSALEPHLMFLRSSGYNGKFIWITWHIFNAMIGFLDILGTL